MPCFRGIKGVVEMHHFQFEKLKDPKIFSV